MKIEEPKTPYEAYDSEDEVEKDELDANLLAARIAAEGDKGPRPRRYGGGGDTYVNSDYRLFLWSERIGFSQKVSFWDVVSLFKKNILDLASRFRCCKASRLSLDSR